MHFGEGHGVEKISSLGQLPPPQVKAWGSCPPPSKSLGQLPPQAKVETARLGLYVIKYPLLLWLRHDPGYIPRYD